MTRPPSPRSPGAPAEGGLVGVRLPRLRRALHLGSASSPRARSRPRLPHFPARAKRVIFLCMEGGPSHVDSFDYKPKLSSDAGKPIGKGRAAAAKLLASPWKFQPARRERPLGLGPVSRGRQACRRPLRRSTACTPTSRTIPRRSSSCTPESSSSPGPRSARGCSTAWEPRTRTSPASSPSARPRIMAGRRTTAAPSCRRSTRGRASDSTGCRSPRPR